MRILLLVERLPYPELDGYGLRFVHHLRRLTLRHQVDVVTYDVGELSGELAASLGSVERVPVRDVPRQPLLRRALDAFSDRALHHHFPAFAEAVRQRVRRGRYDVAWVGGWRMAQYVGELAPVPAVLDATDDEVLAARRELDAARGSFERLHHFRSHVTLARYQRRHFPRARLCLFVTETDAASTRARLPGVRCEVMSNGVDTEHFSRGAPFERLTLPRHPTLVFEGSMSFAPNVDAAQFLVREVLPLVRERLPDTQAWIVGRDPAPEVQALAGAGVVVTGTVPDVRPFLDAATVSVCPLRTGAGIKNKILQAWSMGRPVVATSVSTGGLDARHGRELLIADGKVALAEALVDVIQDTDLAARLAAAGRATVLARHSWADATARLERWLELAAAPPAAESASEHRA